jgi:hypothetical protein
VLIFEFLNFKFFLGYLLNKQGKNTGRKKKEKSNGWAGGENFGQGGEASEEWRRSFARHRRRSRIFAFQVSPVQRCDLRSGLQRKRMHTRSCA